MSRAISGTKNLKGQIFIKQADGGMGRIRCPSCKQLATKTIDPRSGQEVLACKCGRSYVTKPI